MATTLGEECDAIRDRNLEFDDSVSDDTSRRNEGTGKSCRVWMIRVFAFVLFED